MQGVLKSAFGALAVVGCSPQASLLPQPVYRDTDIAMSSIALFDPSRFVGKWYEILSYPELTRTGCTQTQSVDAPRGDGVLDVRSSCLGSGGDVRSVMGEARPIDPGRLPVSFDAGLVTSAPYWVLWVDEGYRTAVVGVPSGRTGWILNRDPTIPSDRMQAAKEILRFNDHDVTHLRMTPQNGL